VFPSFIPDDAEKMGEIFCWVNSNEVCPECAAREILSAKAEKIGANCVLMERGLRFSQRSRKMVAGNSRIVFTGQAYFSASLNRATDQTRPAEVEKHAEADSHN
jgi:hypothetical protein